MRLKYWAFLILLAVVHILFFLTVYLRDWALAIAFYGFGLLLSFYLFRLTVDILAEAIKKRHAYRFVLILVAVSLILTFALASAGNIPMLLGLFAFILLLVALCLARARATLFDIGRGIVSTLVAIGNAVYDFIHFW